MCPGRAAAVIGAAGLATLGEALRAELPGALAQAFGVGTTALAADAVTAYAGCPRHRSWCRRGRRNRADRGRHRSDGLAPSGRLGPSARRLRRRRVDRAGGSGGRPARARRPERRFRRAAGLRAGAVRADARPARPALPAPRPTRRPRLLRAPGGLLRGGRPGRRRHPAYGGPAHRRLGRRGLPAGRGSPPPPRRHGRPRRTGGATPRTAGRGAGTAAAVRTAGAAWPGIHWTVPSCSPPTSRPAGSVCPSTRRCCGWPGTAVRRERHVMTEQGDCPLRGQVARNTC